MQSVCGVLALNEILYKFSSAFITLKQ
uniref:Uncharacterized protein n=1 Tax=Rhizophora mucronata TaxID=61149 RepID=A0A2P2R4R3_RHIMU